MAFTSTQYKRLVAVASVAVASTTQYTVAASTQDVIKCIDVANTTGAAQTITLTIAGTVIFNAMSIAAGATLHWTGTQVLNAGDTIVTAASAVGLALLISGLENT